MDTRRNLLFTQPSDVRKPNNLSESSHSFCEGHPQRLEHWYSWSGYWKRWTWSQRKGFNLIFLWTSVNWFWTKELRSRLISKNGPYGLETEPARIKSAGLLTIRDWSNRRMLLLPYQSSFEKSSGKGTFCEKGIQNILDNWDREYVSRVPVHLLRNMRKCTVRDWWRPENMNITRLQCPIN